MLQRDGGCGAAVQMNRAVRPILLCGRICAGKTTYAKRLGKTRGAVCLSCDELMLALFGQQLGDRHDEIVAPNDRISVFQVA